MLGEMVTKSHIKSCSFGLRFLFVAIGGGGFMGIGNLERDKLVVFRHIFRPLFSSG